MDKEMSLEDRRNYCIAWEKSGKTRLAFCKANGIYPSTFNGWYNRYKRGLLNEPHFSPMVAETSIPAMKDSPSVQCEIHFPNDTQLFISLQEKTLVSIIQEICHAATVIR